MKISIIVPVYMVQNYLSNCINSLINQTYKNIEIILVDDGSRDASGKICDKFAKNDKRIKVIHKKNGGLSSARNDGIKIATGDYIMFVDSDDTLNLKACEQLNNIIKKTNADIVCFNFRHVNSDGSENLKYNNYSLSNTGIVTKFTYEQALSDNIRRHKIRYEATSKIYKRKVANSCLFPNGLLAEDFAVFYIFLKNAKKIVHYDMQLYNYLHRETSIMGKKNRKLYKDIYITEKKFYLEVNNICKKEEDKIVNDNRHLKILLKIYAKIYSVTDDLNIQDELINDINKMNKNRINIKIKFLYYIFKINKKIFVLLFNKFYKNA